MLPITLPLQLVSWPLNILIYFTDAIHTQIESNQGYNGIFSVLQNSRGKIFIHDSKYISGKLIFKWILGKEVDLRGKVLAKMMKFHS